MFKGILLNENNDLSVKHGRLQIGNTKMQNVFILLSSNKGEIKEDALCGVNLLQMIRAKENREKIRKTIEIALERINVKFDDIKDEFELMINKQSE